MESVFIFFFFFEYKLAKGATVHSDDLCQKDCKWKRIELGFTVPLLRKNFVIERTLFPDINFTFYKTVVHLMVVKSVINELTREVNAGHSIWGQSELFIAVTHHALRGLVAIS